MQDLKEINGALSLIGVTDDFVNDYCKINTSTLMCQSNLISKVILRSTEHKDRSFLLAKISTSSFDFLKKMLVNGDKRLQYSIYEVSNLAFNFFENEPILGFCDQYYPDSEILCANIVFQCGSDILCVEVNFGDLLAMSLSSKFSVYIRKEIIDRNGVEYEYVTKS